MVIKNHVTLGYILRKLLIDFIGSVILLLIGLCFIQRGYKIADQIGEV